MKNKILITGAGSGIGKDVSVALSGLGHKVYATAKLENDASSLNKLAKEKGLSLESFKLDITSKKDRERILDYDIDVLINNAAGGESGSLSEIDIDKIRDNFETNLFSTLSLTQLALSKMIKKNSGRVVFISSIAGHATIPFLAPYTMTKAALSNGVYALREEIEKISGEIKIILVEPGGYATGFNQRNIAKKYKWMGERSYFYGLVNKIKIEEERYFRLIEQKSTNSIVNKIVAAVEDENPSHLHRAPWWQGLGVRILNLYR